MDKTPNPFDEATYHGANGWAVYGQVCKPLTVPPGVCTFCGGIKEKWHDYTTLKTQTGGGEVRIYPCWHCKGSGVEPPTIIQRFKAWLRTCDKSPRQWFAWHSFSPGVLHYPAMLSDGEGGCYAGELVKTCRHCGKRRSCGVWARGSDTGFTYYRDVRGGESIIPKEESC